MTNNFIITSPEAVPLDRDFIAVVDDGTTQPLVVRRLGEKLTFMYLEDQDDHLEWLLVEDEEDLRAQTALTTRAPEWTNALLDVLRQTTTKSKYGPELVEDILDDLGITLLSMRLRLAKRLTAVKVTGKLGDNT